MRMSKDLPDTHPPLTSRPPWGPHTGKNVLGSTYFLDANALIDLEQDPSPTTPVGFLYRAFVEGWIGIGLTDTTGVERTGRFGPNLGMNDPALWAFESFGPLTPNHSRLDSCVLGSDDDTARLAIIHRILKPGKQPDQLGDNDFRDGMQINTTIRYGGSYFVTRDKNILSSSRALHEAFGLTVAPPDSARFTVIATIENARAREIAREQAMWLPEWPRS